MKQLTGTGVALVTPFDRNLQIDFDALEKLLIHVTDGGVDYLVVNGTTGESPTITSKEKWKLLEFVFNKTSLPVVLGYGGNSTMELIDEIGELPRFPITAILSVAPYYNKPSQEGLYQHYSLLADKSPVPVILYNVPARTSVNIEAKTTLTLAEHENIVAIKEASVNFDQIREIISHRKKDFLVLSGDDGSTLDLLKEGGEGVISVIANYKTQAFTQMVNMALDGEWSEAEQMNSELKKDYQLLSKEGNPTSVKTALESLGLIHRYVRLPLVAGSEDLLTEFRNN
jgi:4-hydroxy-tetrahydrodipicolinate synthase